MTQILYYSNFCNNSKNVINNISKKMFKIHYLNIDKRTIINGETYIILENGKNIIFPKNIAHVPALLTIDKKCEVIYGNDIINFLLRQQQNQQQNHQQMQQQTQHQQPQMQQQQQQQQQQHTQPQNQQLQHTTPSHLQTEGYNNMTNSPDPTFFSLSCTNSNLQSSIASDNFSFLDMEANELSTKGDGGVKQLHHYSTIHDDQRIMTMEEEDEKGNINKKNSDLTIEQLQDTRTNDSTTYKYSV
jgi:hypothetical protein